MTKEDCTEAAAALCIRIEEHRRQAAAVELNSSIMYCRRQQLRPPAKVVKESFLRSDVAVVAVRVLVDSHETMAVTLAEDG